MLRIALAEVRAGAVETVGEIPADAPLFAGADWPLVAPLVVRGRFSGAGEGKYYWRVHFDTTLRAECRRCLAAVDAPLSLSLGLVFASADDALEGEGCYVIPPRAHEVDLTGAVREELLLAMPRYVECRPDCKGLCPRCGTNLNDGPCGCVREADPRWEALRALTRPDATD